MNFYVFSETSYELRKQSTSSQAPFLMEEMEYLPDISPTWKCTSLNSEIAFMSSPTSGSERQPLKMEQNWKYRQDAGRDLNLLMMSRQKPRMPFLQISGPICQFFSLVIQKMLSTDFSASMVVVILMALSRGSISSIKSAFQSARRTSEPIRIKLILVSSSLLTKFSMKESKMGTKFLLMSTLAKLKQSKREELKMSSIFLRMKGWLDLVRRRRSLSVSSSLGYPQSPQQKQLQMILVTAAWMLFQLLSQGSSRNLESVQRVYFSRSYFTWLPYWALTRMSEIRAWPQVPFCQNQMSSFQRCISFSLIFLIRQSNSSRRILLRIFERI